MSAYSVEIMPKAQKDLDALSGKMLSRFEQIILTLYNEPRPRNSRKLTGTEDKWRIRVGEYRMLYEIYDSRKLVRIYRIAHRREVYR
jgi:mRNA interferase RelE/StbE